MKTRFGFLQFRERAHIPLIIPPHSRVQDQSSCHDTARLEQECRYADDASAWQMLEFDGEGADGQEDGVEMAGFTVKGNALQVPANQAGRQVCGWMCVWERERGRESVWKWRAS